MAANNKKIGEIRIPVPWGHVAAKTWGEPDDQLVLCVHGVMDNAGTFDRLIQRLPSSFYYVCIDLPGHGKSTHFPPHLPIHTTDYLLVYREVTRHFDDRKFVLIGHSYGGQIGFMYAQIYPNHVKSLIMLDTLTSYPVPTDYFDVYMAERIEDHLRIANNLRSNRPPLYTREEALEKLKTGRRSLKPMPTESAEALLTRAIEPAGDLYKFTTDQRLKNFINPLRDYRYFIETVKNCPVKCPVLIVLGNENVYQIKYMEPVISFFKTLSNIEIHEVDGDHDVHNNYPERVAPYLCEFLTFQKAKL